MRLVLVEYYAYVFAYFVSLEICTIYSEVLVYYLGHIFKALKLAGFYDQKNKKLKMWPLATDDRQVPIPACNWTCGL